MRVHLYRPAFIVIVFVSQILFVWLIISVSYYYLDLVVAFFVNFICRLGYYFLSMALCHLSLLRSFSDNFVCT
jgi:hypothetical protein